MEAFKEGAMPKKNGIYRVFCPRYHMPALARVNVAAPTGSRIKVCTVRMRRCDEGCLGSACALN